jgi:CheY-like chemotaxis protein
MPDHMSDQGPLEGKTIAIAGLPASATLQIAERLELEGAQWLAFREGDPSSAKNADALICDVATARRLASPAPVLVLGTIDQFSGAGVASSGDFLAWPPLQTDEMVVRLRRLLERPEGARPRRRTRERPLILTADDDPTTTAIIRAVVTRNGMDCQVAANGKQALEMAKTALPDAMVLDVNMPYLDGFEVLAALRAEPSLGGTAVIMLTSVQQESDVVRGFSLGADDYVVKPFNPMELLARLRRVVERI